MNTDHLEVGQLVTTHFWERTTPVRYGRIAKIISKKHILVSIFTGKPSIEGDSISYETSFHVDWWKPLPALLQLADTAE